MYLIVIHSHMCRRIHRQRFIHVCGSCVPKTFRVSVKGSSLLGPNKDGWRHGKSPCLGRSRRQNKKRGHILYTRIWLEWKNVVARVSLRKFYGSWASSAHITHRNRSQAHVVWLEKRMTPCSRGVSAASYLKTWWFGTPSYLPTLPLQCSAGQEAGSIGHLQFYWDVFSFLACNYRDFLYGNVSRRCCLCFAGNLRAWWWMSCTNLSRKNDASSVVLLPQFCYILVYWDTLHVVRAEAINLIPVT